MTHEEEILFLKQKYSTKNVKSVIDQKLKYFTIGQAIYINLSILDEFGRIIENLFFT